MIAPLLVFVLVMVVAPTLMLLLRAVDDPLVARTLPRTTAALQDWSTAEGLPPEAAFEAIAVELHTARERGVLGTLSGRLNQDYPGSRSLLQVTARKLASTSASGDWRKQLVEIDARWQEPQVWGAIRNASSRFTANYLLQAVDLKRDADGDIVRARDVESIHLPLLGKTFLVAITIAILASLLAFPVAYVLSHLSARKANLVMILVLLPFWTALLVRVTTWIVLLQDQGIVNNLLVALGLIDDQNRLHLMFSLPAVILVGVYVAIPLATLPMYSVMRALPPNLMRAGVSLGSSRCYAFRRIYLPLCLPGIGAGASLIFILVLGYYLTPALVGGRGGTLISNVIAFHMQESLNWSLAAALSTVLLLVALPIYLLNHRLTSRQ
jgi:putative spermidine/putrescine transport system permease protein